MAYKFQNELAIMSGALDQEGPITISDAGGLVQAKIGSPSSGLANGQLSGSGDFFIGDDLFTDGVPLGDCGVNDTLFFKTGVHGAMERESAGDLRDLYFSAVSGDATVASGGALTIANNAINNAKMADDSVGAAELIDDSVGAAAMADNAVGTAVIVDDAVTSAKIATGAVIADGIAASAVEAAALNDNIISGQNALGGASVAQADLLMLDDGPGTVKKVTFSNFEDSIFGNVSSDATVAAGGALTIANDAITSAKIATGAVIADGIAANAVVAAALDDTVISGQTELAADGLAAADEFLVSDGGVLKKIGVDTLFTDGPGLLTAATIAVANDHFMFLDGGATGDAKTESIVDFIAAIAGTGITASGGQLSVSAASGVNALGSGGNADADLLEAFNYASAAITADRTYTLPASAGMTAGDVVSVKLAGLNPGVKVTVARAGSQTIDGLTSIALESPGAAVSLKYLAADTWAIF